MRSTFLQKFGSPVVTEPHESDPLIGVTVGGRYRVRRVIGEGGMGRVYLARHDAIDKDIALKVLHAQYAHRPDIVQRFQQEAKSASRIKHPNVLDVYDFGQLPDGRFYLAAEFLDGRDLAAEVQRKGRPSVGRAIDIVLTLCDALGTAHQRGVVHRDMKPENVFLSSTGVKIVDFGIAKLREMRDEAAAGSLASPDLASTDLSGGIAKLTRCGTVCGTPEYMAPEQAAGREVDGRADIYAVGVILYELLTGRVPFVGSTVVETLTKHLTEPVPRPSAVDPTARISQELEQVLLKALAKNPDDRFSTMQEFAEALVRTPEGRLLSHRLRKRSSTDASLSPPKGMSGPAAPATTQVGFSVERPSARTTKVLAVVGVAMLGMASAAAVYRTSRVGARGAIVTADASAGVASSAPVVLSVVTIVSHVPVVVPATVKLRLVTEPQGAVIKKGGFQVCDTTPCEYTAPKDEALELSAEKADLRGHVKVLAHTDQTVTIKLARPVGAASSAPLPLPKTTETKPKVKWCEVMEGDLKLVRPCP